MLRDEIIRTLINVAEETSINLQVSKIPFYDLDKNLHAYILSHRGKVHKIF